MATQCFAIPGSDTILDMIHPETGRSLCYGKTLADLQVEYPDAVIMSYDAWSDAKAERQHVPVTWEPSTEERFYNMLEVLPPAAMHQGGFLLGEPSDHEARTGQPRYDAFRYHAGRYEAASRPMTVKEFLASAS